MEHTKILALSGSLRQASYNTAALEAISVLSPANVVVEVYGGMGDLPLFNPDCEGRNIPAVDKLVAALGEADGLFIASPEYAHGISGVLKNALDWLVSREEFVHIPVALINTSPRAIHAQAHLREVIATMSGVIVERACITVPLLGSGFGVDAIVNDSEISALLRSSIESFCEAVVGIKRDSTLPRANR